MQAVARQAIPKRKSEALRRSYADRRIAKPPLVRGISVGRLVTISPRDFGKVDVDRRYQRDRIDSRVNLLVEVLKAGGTIPDPITVVHYTFTEIGVDNTKMWLVDGQQRFFAHLEAEKPVQAMVYEASSLDAVREFFLAMQNVVHVVNNLQVNVSTAICAEILRQAATEGVLKGRVALTQGVRRRLAAASLVRGMLIAATGKGAARGQHSSIAGIQGVMARLDAEIAKHRAARERAEGFLALVAACAGDSCPSLVISVLARVAFDKWNGSFVRLPGEVAAKKLATTDWASKVPTYAERFAPVIEAEIRRVWR